MLKGIALIFLAPFLLVASFSALRVLNDPSSPKPTPSPYERVLSQRPQWPEAVSSTPQHTRRTPRTIPVVQSGAHAGPFCTQLGGFAAAVARDRDAGSTLRDSLRTLDEVADAQLYRIMHAIIFDLYSNTLLTPAVAQQTTETLCRQGFMAQSGVTNLLDRRQRH